MHTRCENPNDPAFKHYGARGISVCSAWSSFEAFATDMGAVPKGYSLDRVDNDSGYSKENCRWATMTQQLNNQRRNVRVAIGEETKTLGEWATFAGLEYSVVWRRHSRGVTGPRLIAQNLKAARTPEHGSRRGYETLKCRCDDCKAFNTTRARKYRAHNV